jgi:hypothetical protein
MFFDEAVCELPIDADSSNIRRDETTTNLENMMYSLATHSVASSHIGSAMRRVHGGTVYVFLFMITVSQQTHL